MFPEGNAFDSLCIKEEAELAEWFIGGDRTVISPLDDLVISDCLVTNESSRVIRRIGFCVGSFCVTVPYRIEDSVADSAICSGMIETCSVLSLLPLVRADAAQSGCAQTAR